MTTIAKTELQFCTENYKFGWNHILVFAQELSALLRQRRNLSKLKSRFELEHKNTSDIGLNQLDLISAYSSQFKTPHSE